MSDAPQDARRFHAVEKDLYAILRENRDLLEQAAVDGAWQERVKKNEVFYVRGFSTFERDVLQKADQGNYALLTSDVRSGQLRNLLYTRPNWLDTPFGWRRELKKADIIAAQQFQRASWPGKKKQPLQFIKGVMVIAICELLAAKLRSAGATIHEPACVYDYMRLEPALSRVAGLSSADWLRDVFTRFPGLEQELRIETKHPDLSNDVFFQMAGNLTVTHKLATTVALVLNRHRVNGNSQGDFRVEIDLDSKKAAPAEIIA